MSYGTWPKNCLQSAFVAGAKWWEYSSTGSTMWKSDRNMAEAEAVKRYGEPQADQSWPKPCPFCGATPVRTPIFCMGYVGDGVSCKCGAQTPRHLTDNDAIKWWNQRDNE